MQLPIEVFSGGYIFKDVQKGMIIWITVNRCGTTVNSCGITVNNCEINSSLLGKPLSMLNILGPL